MLKIEIFVWILLTIILLLTPLILFLRNRTTYVQKFLETIRSKLDWAIASLQNYSQSLQSPETWLSQESQPIENAPETYKNPLPSSSPKTEKEIPQERTAQDILQEKKVNKIEEKRKREKEIKKIEEIKMSALTHKERGNIDEYEKKLIEWLAIDPKNKKFLELLSDYYFESGKYVKAMTLLKKLVNEYPDYHKAIWQIGQIYVFQNDLDTAKILIEKAISLKGDNPKYHISLVDIHYAKHDLDEAIKSMERVLKLRPKSINYHLSIASLHEENSEPTRALQYYSKVIELDPMQEIAKSWINRLS